MKNKSSFILKCDQGVYLWRDAKINSKCYWRCVLSRNVLLKTKVCRCLYMESEWWKLLRMFSMQSGCYVFNFAFKDQKWTIMLFGGDGTHCFVINTSHDYPNEKPFLFLRKFLCQRQSATPEPVTKKQKSLHWLIHLKKFQFSRLVLQFQSTVKQHDFLSLQRRYWVVFRPRTSISFCDCRRSRPGNDHNFPRNSSGSIELFDVPQTGNFNNHLPRVPITPNQERKM